MKTFNKSQADIDRNHINNVYPEGDIQKLGIGFDGQKYLNVDWDEVGEYVNNVDSVVKDISTIYAAVKPAPNPTTPLVFTPAVSTTTPAAALAAKSSSTWIWVTVGGVVVIGTGLILFFTLKK